MSKLSFKIFLIVFIIAFLAAPVLATKPGEDVNPNGFPSGEHYNLNIHGKKADFTCPEQEYYLRVKDDCEGHETGALVEECPEGCDCEQTEIPIYGNSIFVPEDGVGIKIYMQSGKAGGKGKKAEALPQNELWAIDPCAVFDGDGAIIQLPPGEYDVYARALAKPTDNPYMTVSPELIGAEDENGNDLVYLGLVTDDGFETPSQTFVRKKGKSKAIPITGLFNWTGTVCYFEEPEGWEGTPTTYCCYDYESDDIWDYCCFGEDTSGIYEEDECSGDLSGFVEGACTEVDTYCNEYMDEWVFNIGDFVNYLWNADNHGLKLLQVRFYPR